MRVEVEAGRLRWGYDAACSFVARFPSRGTLGQTAQLQDDDDAAPEEDETFIGTMAGTTAETRTREPKAKSAPSAMVETGTAREPLARFTPFVVVEAGAQR